MSGRLFFPSPPILVAPEPPQNRVFCLSLKHLSFVTPRLPALGFFRAGLLALPCRPPPRLTIGFFRRGPAHCGPAFAPGAGSGDVSPRRRRAESALGGEGEVHCLYRPVSWVLPGGGSGDAGGAPEPCHGQAAPRISCPHTMDSVPATVPSVTTSPGDPQLLGPLSVLYAALIAKLLEVTDPIPAEGPQPRLAGG